MSSLEDSSSGGSIVRLILAVAGVVVILAGVKAMGSFVALILFSFLIVVIFMPLHRRLRARGLSNSASALTILLVIVLGSLVIGAIAGIALFGALLSLPTYLHQFQERVSQASSVLAQSGADVSTFAGALNKAAAFVLDSIAGVATAGVGLLVNWGMFILIVAFALFEVESFPRLLQRALGGTTPTYRRFATTLTGMSTFISIIALINLAIGACSAVFLWLIGIPHPLLWGFMSFVFGFIPYVGYWIAILPPLILAFGTGGASLALIVLLGYWAINGVFSSVLAPRMLGKGLDLSVVLTLVSVLFWIVLLGPMGGILAVPLTLIIKAAILGSYRGTAWLSVALGDSGRIDEPVATAENPAQL